MISTTLITYLGAAIAAYLGLALGSFLIHFAPEEKKPGAAYFILGKKIIFTLIIAMILFFFKVHPLVQIAVFTFLLILLLTKKLSLQKNGLVYILFGVVFFVSKQIQELLIVESILICLYGMLAASVLYDHKKKNYKQLLTTNAWFFVPVLLFPLLPL